MSQLKVQVQTGGYKIEYESALREMYDTHQFENRMRKMAGDIDQSQRKAQILQEELARVNDQWEVYYAEAIKQLKQRVDEISAQANIEQIEQLL